MPRKREMAALEGGSGPAARWRGCWEALAAGAVLPFLVAVLLLHWDVPLGVPGRLVYLYSPVIDWRMEALPWAGLLAVLAAGGVWLAAGSSTGRARVGLALVMCGVVGLGVWSYFAPPDYLNQHVFNMLSPAQDGAFVRESLEIDDLPAYLRAFPERARTPPEQMRGTRVISNPPATTVLAVLVRRSIDAWPALGRFARAPFEFDDLRGADFPEQAAVGVAVDWVFTALWMLSGPLLYAIGRLFLAPASAATFALCGLVSPMTLLFTPGKDTAQLFTVALPLCLWFLSQERGWWWAAVAGGAVLVCSAMVSLVHVWLAAVVVGAGLLSARHTPGAWWRIVLGGLVPAALGALVAGIALQFGCGLNVPATIWAVTQAQAEVTRGTNAMPWVWQLLGIPLFLLFAGPCVWTFVWWLFGGRVAGGPVRDERARFGGYVLVCCGVVMVATVGFTNVETPRLWIPFVLLLLLGAALALPELRQPAGRRAWLLAGVVFAQVVFSALQWALMDMREAETRLLTNRFFG